MPYSGVIGALAHEWLSGWGAGGAVSDVLTSTATSAQSLSVEATSESGGSTGSSVNDAAEAISEALSQSESSTYTLVEVIQIVELPLQNIATSSVSLAESITFAEIIDISASSTQVESSAEAESETNSSTSTTSILSADAEATNNSGSGSQIASDATSEAVDVSAAAAQTTGEATAEAILVSATASQSMDEEIVTLLVQEVINTTSDSTQSLAETSAENLNNLASSDQTLSEEILFTEAPLQNVAASSPSLAEVTAEGLDTLAAADQAIGEEAILPEAPMVNVGSSSQTIDEGEFGVVTEDITSYGSSDQALANEAVAETLTNRPVCPEFVQVIGRMQAQMEEVIQGEEEPFVPTPVVPGDVSLYQGGALYPLQNTEQFEEVTETYSTSENSLMEEIYREVVIYLDKVEESRSQAVSEGGPISTDVPASQVEEPVGLDNHEETHEVMSEDEDETGSLEPEIDMALRAILLAEDASFFGVS